MTKKPKNQLYSKIGGSDFTQAIRNNIQPIDQLYTIKDSSNILLKNTKHFFNIYSPFISPIARKLTSIPCAAAKMYTNAICDPLVNNVKSKHIGGAKYKNHYYNYIYDPISGKYYHILSKRGEATLMGFIGKQILS
jgi:hypothetical protein